MTLLVISPDFASHAVPMITIAGAWQRRGHRVIVATGPAMAPLVRSAGMEHAELIMSRGSNPGVLPSASERDEESRSLVDFFEATRGGMVDALRHQAEARAVDLLWRPRQVALRTMRLVDLHEPDAVLMDHLAFASGIGLRAKGVPYGDVVLGHPTALPVGDEVYGVPTAWPAALQPPAVELASLRATASGVGDAFTTAYNETLLRVLSNAEPVEDAFKAHGSIVLYNYPAEMHGMVRTAKLPAHAFLGSAVRAVGSDGDAERWLDEPNDDPVVVVSFGTFLSARRDVLERVARSLRRLPVRVALAIGSNDMSHFDGLPEEWHIRPTLPQVALLERASLLITHAGNNSVTESLTYGVPMLAMPFSTDQFDGAAAIERHSVGLALDPQSAPRPLIAGSVRGLLRTPPPKPAAIGARLRKEPGPEVAYAAMAELRPSESVEQRPREGLTPAPPSIGVE